MPFFNALGLLLILTGFSWGQAAGLAGTWALVDSVWGALGIPYQEEIHIGDGAEFEARSRKGAPEIDVFQVFYPWRVQGDSLLLGLSTRSVSVMDSGGPDQEINYGASSYTPAYRYSLPDSVTLVLVEKGCRCRSVYKKRGNGLAFSLPDLLAKFPNRIIGSIRPAGNKQIPIIGFYSFQGSGFDLTGRRRGLKPGRPRN